MSRARAAWARVEPRVDTRAGTLVVGLVALVAHSLLTLVFPVIEGRDYVTYLRVYAEMWSWTSVIPWEMLWRMPVAPALLGVPLDLLGPWGARVVIALGFAATVMLWFRVATRFGPLAAVATAVVLVASPSFGLLFHRYSSDAVAGVVFAALALATARAWERPTTSRFALLGVSITVMVLTRPAHQVALALVLLPLLRPGGRHERVRWIGACALCSVLPLLLWIGMNGARYDDRALSRGGGAWLPFYRVYLTDRLVDPANGPASRELAELVRTRLLTREPYVSYGIDLERFFAEPTTRYHEDLVGLTDRALGWDQRNALMRRAAIEGIRKDPLAFGGGVARSLVQQLGQPVQLLPPAGKRDEPQGSIVVDGDEVPRPSEGGSIPAASFSYWLSRPDNAFDEVWTSPVDHHVVSRDPELLRRLERLEARVAGLRLEPSHDGSAAVMVWVNRASRLFPPALLWLLVGVVAVAVRRPVDAGLAVVLSLVAVVTLLATVLSVPPVPEFGAPFLPAFVLLGLAGLLGRQAPRAP